MPYDFQRGLMYGAGAAAATYFGSGIINQVAGYVPGAGSSEAMRPALAAALGVIAVDAAYQSFRG